MSDVRARSTQAAERNGGTGRLRDLEHGSRWERLFKWERLTVNGQSIEKGVVITPMMGLALALAISTVIGGMYYRTNDAIQAQSAASAKESRELRDMMIETKTRLDERTNFQKEAESERKRDQTANEETAKVWRETMSLRMNIIEKRR